MIIQLWRRLLQDNLALGNSRCFLASVLLRLACTLSCLVICLIWLLNWLRLSWVCIQHNGCSCCYSRRLNIVVRVRLCAGCRIWRPSLCVYLTSIWWNHYCSTLRYHTTVETWIASSLERVLPCILMVLLMLCLLLWLVIVLCKGLHDWLRLLRLYSWLRLIWAYTGRHLIRLLQQLLIHNALTLPFFFRRWLLRGGMRMLLRTVQLILVVLVSGQLTVSDELPVLLRCLHLQLIRVLLLLLLSH